MSRNGNEFKSFSILNETLPSELRAESAVLDARLFASTATASRNFVTGCSDDANQDSLRSIWFGATATICDMPL
jgi:hypothetical protein